MRLLIVDPDEYYQYYLQEALTPPHELWLTENGQDLKQILKEFRPEAVITELLLKDRTGYDLLADLRGEEQKVLRPDKRFLIIVFTSIDKLEDVSAALELGVNHYLVKGRDTIRDLKNLLLILKSDHDYGL